MKKFNEFGISPASESFTGDKIKMSKVLNVEIAVHKFKIDDSTKKPGTKYLNMQISVGETKHVLFSGSNVLMEMIKRIPEDGFPFTTTIVEENERYKFT